MDRDRQIFKVPWKHGGKQDWVPEQSQIFKEWACHTGKFREGVDTPTYAKWKTNLRCALNKAPDIHELSELTRKSDPNPYKVYQFLKRKKRVPPPVVTAPDPKPVPVSYGSDVAPVPVFLSEYTTPNEVTEQPENYVGPTLMQQQQPQNQLTPAVSSPAQDQSCLETGNNYWNIPNEPQPCSFGETMDIGDMLTGNPADAMFMPSSSACAMSTATTGLSNVPLSTQASQIYAPSNPVQGQYNASPAIGHSVMVYNTEQNDPNAGVEGHPHLPFDKSVPSHNCVSVTGSEMYLEIIYRNNIINSQHIKTQSRGCRITYTMVPRNIEEEIPDVIKDALFGPGSKDRELVELPQWPMGICPDNLLPSVNDLLQNMHRGIIMECYSGNIYATRLCKTSLYYSTEFTPATQKLLRHDDSIEKTKIFDMDNDFKPALEMYQKGAKRPNPYVYLYVGQKGSESDLSSLLIVVRLTSCQALTLLNEVDKCRCQDHSMHISRSTELDQLGECVRKQLNGQLHL